MQSYPKRALLASFLSVYPCFAWGSDVTWERIAGQHIEVILRQTRRVQIDEGTFTDQHQWRFKITPAANGALHYTRQDFGQWLDRPGNRKPSASPVGVAQTALGKVHPNPDGRGTAVWTFDAGRLTRISVETIGAKGRMIAISLSGGTLKCNAEITDVGEEGKGKTWVNAKGQKRKLIATLRQSTTCEVNS
jgi:hypothetical protein